VDEHVGLIDRAREHRVDEAHERKERRDDDNGLAAFIQGVEKLADIPALRRQYAVVDRPL
jgi:hypothetical protein